MGSPACISMPLAPLSSRQHHNSHSQTQSRQQSSRRSSWNHNHALIPSSVTPAAAKVTRPELNRSATTTSASRASTLLSKVVSSPGSRRCSSPISMLTTPINEKGDLQFHDLDDNVNNGEGSPQWEDAMRYWDGHDQQGKSITLSTLNEYTNICRWIHIIPRF